MQAGLMLPGSVRGDSRREGGRGKGREREGGKERLQAGGQREFPVCSDDDVLRMLIMIIMALITRELIFY